MIPAKKPNVRVCYSCKETRRVHQFYGDGNECKGCQSIRKAKSYLENQPKHRESWLQKNYKISVQEYEDQFRAQTGICAICKRTDLSGRRLAVDHDHETGRLRGLICLKCNRGLGCFDDNKEFLANAVTYLKEANKPRYA